MTDKKWIATVLFLIAVNLVSSPAASWQTAVDRVSNSVGLIEFFQQVPSAQALEEKSRFKRRLTGILVDKTGLMITSSSLFSAELEFSTSSIHSMARLPEDITVRFPERDPIPATFIGKDDDMGLAFIRLENTEGLVPVTFQKPGSLGPGERVLIVQHLGNDYNYEPFILERTINAVIEIPHRVYLCENQLNTITDFGFVMNTEGLGLGVIQSSGKNRIPVRAMLEPQMAEIHPFVSIETLINKPPVFREKETDRKKWLGINMQPFTREMAGYYNAPELKGVLVNTILEDSPAERAGFRVGDVITSINGTPVEAEEFTDLELFRNLIRDQKDDRVLFQIFRNNAVQPLSVELADTPIGQFLAEEVTTTALGFSVKELTKDIILAKQLNFDTEGVWVSRVEQAGWADIAGLSVGDLILKANNRAISELDDIRGFFDETDRNKPDYVSLFIRRGTETRFLFIKTNFTP